MAELDKLLVKIQVDLADLKKGMKKAQDTVKQGSSSMSGGFGRMTRSVDNLGKKVIQYGAVFAGVFGVLAVKKVLDVGMSIENLEIQLKNLFGSAEEGAKAFQIMSEYAGQVPFELSQIQKGAGSLAAVAKRAEDLNELLFITGNVASVTGLDFAKTAEQIQRSFSSGIASADLFREKAVKSLLGFTGDSKAGIEETQQAFRDAFGRGGTFSRASEEFALTLTGTISMLSDKMFNFQKAIADGFFQELKIQMNHLNNQLAVNQKGIQDFGKEIGKNIGEAIKFIADNLDEITDALIALAIVMGSAVFVSFGLWLVSLRGMLSVVTLAVFHFRQEIQDATQDLRDFIRTNAVIRFLNPLMELSDATDKVKVYVKELFNVAKAWEIIQESQAKAMGTTVEQLDKNRKANDRFKDDISKIFTEIDGVLKDATQGIADAFGGAMAKGEDFKSAMKEIFQSVVAEVISLVFRILILEPMLEKLQAILKDIKTQIQDTADAMYNLGFSELFSMGMKGVTQSFSMGNGSTDPSTPGTVPAMAHGGFVMPNTPYMVGERGAELFTPQTAGNITPASQSGGSIVINQSLNFSTGVQQTVRSEIIGLMPQIKEQTVKAVAETRSRGGAFARTFGA